MERTIQGTALEGQELDGSKNWCLDTTETPVCRGYPRPCEDNDRKSNSYCCDRGDWRLGDQDSDTRTRTGIDFCQNKTMKKMGAEGQTQA